MVDLEKEIKVLRSEMEQLAVTKGLQHPETIQASQCLDKLIVKSMKEMN